MDEVDKGQAEGGKSASGETIPIQGVKHVRVSFNETTKDLIMNVKVIKGLSKFWEHIRNGFQQLQRGI